ncbi:serine hydrolase [uncultured Ramlibacter sp.]|uniref:serine hydrolase domain-containing protein n=1 Tax=uncultured Ramlibacter sp. TaxID=260755 RepID=UPI002629A2F8|nr:serine hydrolase [uncultured Ramlibacter sp.]
MRRCPWIIALLLFLVSLPSAATGTFPREHWESFATPEDAGFSSEGLRAAQAHASSIDTAAVMLVVQGRVVTQWGRTAERLNVHSIRKSLVSALYGIAVGDGTVSLDSTLAELRIDDNEPSLTEGERRATVRQLITARSGVYHPALYETPGMAAMRPLRGSHSPGTFWYYNNWDFNALGTIYVQATGTDIFEAFQARIAKPLRMEDWRSGDGEYFRGRDSIHAAYPFRMSARDLARFGLLYLHRGNWEGNSIIPSTWVKDSVAAHSDAGFAGGYGYLWWVAVNGRHLPFVNLPAGSFSAQGAGGHYLLVIPSMDLVLVHRVNTDIRGQSVNARQFGELVRLILEARVVPAANARDRESNRRHR